MAKQSYSVSVDIELQDMDRAKRTIVRVKLKDAADREWVRERTVAAPPKESQVTAEVGHVLKEMVDRGVSFVDFSGFQSRYKEDEDTIHAQEGKPQPPLMGIPAPEAKSKDESPASKSKK